METHHNHELLSSDTENKEQTTLEGENTQSTPRSETTEAEANISSSKPASKSDVLMRLEQLVQQPSETSRQELDFLKQHFYKLHHSEIEAAKAEFVAQGGLEEDFMPLPDEAEERFKTLMGHIKAERSKQAAELEQKKEENLKIKLAIIEELKELVESADESNPNYTEFKKLQQQWADTNPVPQGQVNELWKSYHLYVEQFYDLLKLNSEFREYDFKKNLEIKTHLCEAAEKLSEEPDVVSAFHQLQKLHQEYREAGPVSKELREEVWQRFKNASTAINRRHQQHFEKLKQEEQQNLEQKTALCEAIENLNFGGLTTFAQWEEKTQEVMDLQAQWKTIGFAPQKVNTKIFERFRQACDKFFAQKAEYFKAQKEEMNENLSKKKALCEQVEALKDSTDWKATTDRLIQLQKEWKTIGPVSRKHSDAIWKRFIAACDYFFEQKGKAASSQRGVEQENLDKKKALIEQLRAAIRLPESEELVANVRQWVGEWGQIGHVPFKEKDKIYKEYRELVDELFERFNLSNANRKLNDFRTNINQLQTAGSQTLYRERERMIRIYENMKAELLTYENNLGFLSSASKKGNSLLAELNRKAEKLKADLELMREKIKVLEQSIKDEK